MLSGSARCCGRSRRVESRDVRATPGRPHAALLRVAFGAAYSGGLEAGLEALRACGQAPVLAADPDPGTGNVPTGSAGQRAQHSFA